MISIEYAWVLWLLPLPLLVRWMLPTGNASQKSALKVPFYSKIASIFLQTRVGFHSSLLNLLYAVIIWCLLVFAASNPVWLGEPIQITQSGRAIMLAVDLSGSMNEPDMIWQGARSTRLNIVKAIGSSFIESRAGDRLGLILFGSNAYLQAPLTFDRATVSEMLSDASIGLAGPQTAIGDAIGLAIKSLERYSDKEKILILLTDGSNNTGNVQPLDVAAIAAKNNIRIFTIGLGANRAQGLGVFAPVSLNPSDDLDEKSLQEIANMTGGMFFRATSSNNLVDVYKKINELIPVKSDETYLQPKTPIYPWLLGFCLFMFFILSVSKFLMPNIIRQRQIEEKA